MTKPKGALSTRKPWTDEQLAILRDRYPHEPTGALVALIGRTASSIYGKAAQLGLKKTAEYLAGPHACRLRRDDNPGIQSRFQPGFTPWNKGKKIGSHPGSVATQFKPGHLSGRALEVAKPIGTERITKDGYRQRKINNDLPFYKRWRLVQLIVWEENFGPVPKGHAITFRDGNRQNCAPENLALIKRSDLMAKNTVHNLPKPLAELVQLRGALNRKINRLQRKNEDGKRNNS